MDVEIPIDGAIAKIDGDALIISFEKRWHALSSAIVGGGFSSISHILNLHVPKDYHNDAPEEDIIEIAKELDLVEDIVGMMTAADLHNLSVVSEEEEGVKVVAIVTGGISNAATCGEAHGREMVGTINTVLLIDANLTDSAMVSAIKTATEAKTLALHDLDVRSITSGEMATGTTTDTIVIACTGKGPEIRYSGTATALGRMIGKTIRGAVRRAIEKQNGLQPNRSISQRLDERGITEDDLVEAAMALFVPHPGLKTEEEAETLFRETLEKELLDANVSSLIMAGFRLEEDAKVELIPTLEREDFENDSVNIVSDEVLGMAIAEYIGGTRARFEYVRFDRKKPGVLSELGPFVDDVVCGLIAGVSSKMYSEGAKD